MKKLLIVAMIAVSFTACKEDKYVDLNTNKEVYLMKDDKTGYMIDTVTKQPVWFYVNTANNDTFYGKTGAKINGTYAKVKMDAEAEMAPKEGMLNADGTTVEKRDNGDIIIKNEDADYKKKIEADGDVKIKSGDDKVKYDADKDELKTKKRD